MDARKRVPVIVGVGEYTDKPIDPREGLEPLEIILRSVSAAEADVGCGMVRRIDRVAVVSQISWPYLDLPGLIAKRLRLGNAELSYGDVGGETPLKMLVESALEIAEGRSDVILLCGAEALKTAGAYGAAGEKPDWTDEDSGARLPTAEQYVTDQAALYGLVNPVAVYSLYENAIRAAQSLDFESMQAQTADIWSRMSSIAAENPYAWTPRKFSAEEIESVSHKNRLLNFPYCKYMCAQIGVNQGSAILLTHRDFALELGIPEDRLVYIGSGAGACEPKDFLKRRNYHQALALEQSLLLALELNELDVSDIDAYELYSCFPCVPKLAMRALGLQGDTSISVTGGLTFFGGPGNNYMTHAIAAMTRRLRKGKDGKGLLHGNGEFVTKHYAMVLSKNPSAGVLTSLNLQEDVERNYGAVPSLLDNYEGPCTLETYTAEYSSDGLPDRAAVIALTPAGERVVARVTESARDELQFLTDPLRQAVGSEGSIYDGMDGSLHWSRTVPDK